QTGRGPAPRAAVAPRPPARRAQAAPGQDGGPEGRRGRCREEARGAEGFEAMTAVRGWARLAALLSVAGALSCAAIPQPSVLDDIDRVRVSPAAKTAERDAPAAFALAEK